MRNVGGAYDDDDHRADDHNDEHANHHLNDDDVASFDDDQHRRHHDDLRCDDDHDPADDHHNAPDDHDHACNDHDDGSDQENCLGVAGSRKWRGSHSRPLCRRLVAQSADGANRQPHQDDDHLGGAARATAQLQ
jgi:hypothetical protein